jgi:flagella basal body P-ring formation protein FlgA
MKRLVQFMMITSAAVCLRGGAALADTIAMKTFVRVAPGAPVTLGDVADLSGPDAESLAGTVLLPADRAAESASVDVVAVREALKAIPRLNMGRLQLSGSACRIRVWAADSGPAPAARAAKPPVPIGETVKDRVGARIASALSADPVDLKLDFEDQAELLAMPVAGRTVAVQPTGISDKMAMSIRVYDGDMIVSQGVARVAVQVRRDVVVATTPLARGAQTRPEMLQADRQWMTPSSQPATAAQALGAVVKGHVDAGKVVMTRDVEPPIIVKKGDLVSVDCVAGSVVVGTTARAKENGADGQAIELQSLQSKKTFLARINGAGRAVMVVKGSDDAEAAPESGK